MLQIDTLAINVQPNPVQFVQMNTEYWVVPIQNTDPLHHEGVISLINSVEILRSLSSDFIWSNRLSFIIVFQLRKLFQNGTSLDTTFLQDAF